MSPETVFVVNPVAGNGRTGRRWHRYHRFFREALPAPFEVRMTRRPWHAAELTKEALESGATTIVCVGGDGTLNEVVNGYLDGTGRPWNPEARIAVFSLGTGSDFVRTLGLSPNPDDLARRLQGDRVRTIDVGVCEYVGEGVPRARYFINVGEFGSGGAVVDRVNRTTKILGGRISFLLAILRTLPKYRNTRVAYTADRGPKKEVVMNDFIVANGRFFGGGLMPAPHADPEDGLFDVVIIGDIDFRTARRNLPALREGRHLELPDVTSFRAREIRFEANEEMIDLDGECVGRRPERFELLPKRVRVVV